jgi:hypothetical protein|tara:strand:- start:209 stop:373 length:165 start_codon:yes stop_codon:yes gene_type:complete
MKPGEENDIKVKSFNGISVDLLRGALGSGYRKDWTEEQINEWKDYERDIIRRKS